MIRSSTIIILLAATLCACKGGEKSRKSGQEFTVSGKITLKERWCGGMAPDPQYLEEFTKVKPYYGKVLYIREGLGNDINKPIVDTITSDKEGKYSIQLRKGTYTAVQQEHLTEEVLTKYTSKTGQLRTKDPDCIRAWWDKGVMSFEVKGEDLTNLNIHIKRACFRPEGVPCLQYYGPYPP